MPRIKYVITHPLALRAYIGCWVLGLACGLTAIWESPTIIHAAAWLALGLICDTLYRTIFADEVEINGN